MVHQRAVEIVHRRDRQLEHHRRVAGHRAQVVRDRRQQQRLGLDLVGDGDVDLGLDDGDESGRPDPPNAGDPSAPTRFEVMVSTAERYEVALELGKPAWLFIADAWYPGWEARIDGEPAAVQPANALGKAVAVPAGAHRVEVRFHSASARSGAALTVATLLAILLGLLWQGLARRAREAAP